MLPLSLGNGQVRSLLGKRFILSAIIGGVPFESVRALRGALLMSTLAQGLAPSAKAVSCQLFPQQLLKRLLADVGDRKRFSRSVPSRLILVLNPAVFLHAVEQVVGRWLLQRDGYGPLGSAQPRPGLVEGSMPKKPKDVLMDANVLNGYNDYIMSTKKERQQRHLLVTTTNEPFQPIRLYYTIPDRSSVVRKLKKLECTVEAPTGSSWHWLYHGEAAPLKLTAGGYNDVPEDRRPIILGRIRFPKRTQMTIETYSIERAVTGARFFARRLGVDVVATRCRVVNRCFAAEEGQPHKLMTSLDRDVTVIDPREAEAAIRRELAGIRSPKDAEQAAAKLVEKRLKSNEDVPLVEDFPLAPEEETSELQHLANTLQLRLVRAVEHWRGNTHLTLTAIIVRAVEQGMADAQKSRPLSTANS